GVRIGPLPEELRGDEVDARIGALRREDRRGEELEGAPMVQRALRVGIALVEAAEDGADRRADRGLWTAGRQFHQRDRATARNSSAPRQLSTSSFVSHPLRAMPTPYSMFRIPAMLCASAPSEMRTPALRAAGRTRQSR